MTDTILLDDKYELYRVVTDFEGLHEAFRDRVEDLEVTRQELDAVSGLQPGYSAKLLCDPPIKSIGKQSLPKMLKATGMALVLVIDDERFAPIKAQMSKRVRPLRANARIVRPAWLFCKDKAREMGTKRWSGVSEKQRKRLAKKAAKARWNRERERRSAPEPEMA